MTSPRTAPAAAVQHGLRQRERVGQPGGGAPAATLAGRRIRPAP
jgi:hypothetical protein